MQAYMYVHMYACMHYLLFISVVAQCVYACMHACMCALVAFYLLLAQHVCACMRDVFAGISVCVHRPLVDVFRTPVQCVWCMHISVHTCCMPECMYTCMYICIYEIPGLLGDILYISLLLHNSNSILTQNVVMMIISTYMHIHIAAACTCIYMYI